MIMKRDNKDLNKLEYNTYETAVARLKLIDNHNV